MITWDEAKRRKVIREHRVDFAKLADVFEDPFAIDAWNPVHNDEEDRWARIGQTAEYGLILVIFTFRDDDIRLVTARKAERWMVRFYEKQAKGR